MSKDKLYITLIVDVSASMDDKLEGTQAGVRRLAEENPDARFNLIEFGYIEGVETKHKRVKAKKLLKYKATANYNTPMWDGIGDGLSLIDHDEKNMVVIVTDGEENHSQYWSQPHIKTLLKAVQSAGTEFIYLGVDVNSVEVSENMGIRGNRVFSYSANDAGATSALNFASDFSNYYSTGNRTSEQLDNKGLTLADADENLKTSK